MKAVYTIPELAKMASVTRSRMRRMLDSYEVEYLNRSGHGLLVPLSEIRDKIKPLYDSFYMRERYEQVVATLGGESR